jgi:rubredoxin
MAHVTTEAEYEDAKRDNRNEYMPHSKECPECGAEMPRTEYYPATRQDPESAMWECPRCDFSEEY